MAPTAGPMQISANKCGRLAEDLSKRRGLRLITCTPLCIGGLKKASDENKAFEWADEKGSSCFIKLSLTQ